MSYHKRHAEHDPRRFALGLFDRFGFPFLGASGSMRRRGLRLYSLEERYNAAAFGGFNPFNFPAEMFRVNFLTDSGTSLVTPTQHRAARRTMNAYAKDPSTGELLEAIRDVFGIEASIDIPTRSWRDHWVAYLYPQCRTAEMFLFTYLGQKGSDLVVPFNTPFDTTEANIKYFGHMSTVEFLAEHTEANSHFGGNMDVSRLDDFLSENSHRVPCVFVTVPNNTASGWPVSLQNLREVRTICNKYDLPLFLDLCRYAKNAWAIKRHEPEFATWSVREIVYAMVALCDGITISFKKECAPMGGALMLRSDSPLFLRYPDLLKNLRLSQTIGLSNKSQGGISGEDRFQIAEGLRHSICERGLAAYERQVATLGNAMKRHGIPVREPFGCHAIYVDVPRFFDGTTVTPDHYGGSAVVAFLLLAGVCACDLGFAFGEYKDGHEVPPPAWKNSIRFAIPRGLYSKEDFDYVARCVGATYQNRRLLPHLHPLSGHDEPLRHMETRFGIMSR